MERAPELEFGMLGKVNKNHQTNCNTSYFIYIIKPQNPGIPGCQNPRIYTELQGTHEDHHIQFMASKTPLYITYTASNRNT